MAATAGGTCCKCGKPLFKSAPRFCRACGADQMLKSYYHALDNPVTMGRLVEVAALYLGGLPNAPEPASGPRVLLMAATWGVGYRTAFADGPVLTWGQVECVSVEGGEITKSKTAAVVAFGVLGGLAAKGKADRSHIIIETKDGAQGVWQIDRMQPAQVRASLSPVLSDAKVPLGGVHQQAQSNAPRSVAAELSTLADLCERGFLTREEFDTQKRALLGGAGTG